MDLPVSFFVCHSSLLTAKRVDLVVASFTTEIICIKFFIVVTLITKELFKQLLIHTAV